MTVVQESGTGIKRFRGLSTDDKPGVDDLGIDRAFGSIFTELDTGAKYVWGGNVWVRQEQTIETLINELRAVNEELLAAMRLIQHGLRGKERPAGRYRGLPQGAC